MANKELPPEVIKLYKGIRYLTEMITTPSINIRPRYGKKALKIEPIIIAGFRPA